MAATAAQAFILSRITNLSLKNPLVFHLKPLQLHQLSRRRSRASVSSSAIISCLSGGGVSDDYFVSTRRSGLERGFAVIANMLGRIEPLDTSAISKAVSDSAKDSMKQTISSMLGLLPSDQFDVSVSVSKQPLHRLVISSIITGYTLWNAEYRVSLMRNFDISMEKGSEGDDSCSNINGVTSEEKNGEEKTFGVEELEKISPQVLGDLSPEALNYIQQLQAEISSAKEELDSRTKENKKIEYDRCTRNDLLEYLRSLDPEMVNEISQPSSPEVEEIIHQLAQNVLQRFYKDETTDSVMGNSKNNQDSGDEIVGPSRDYLAKLIFWCMLLGHHLRGLENRLQLSCVVGLL